MKRSDDFLDGKQLPVAEVVLYTNMAIATIYRKMKDGSGFPAPQRAGGNRVYWSKESIDQQMLNNLNKKGKK